MRKDFVFPDLRLDTWLLGLLLLMAFILAARAWLHENPQHNPWAPLDLRHPPGLAMPGKLSSLRNDPAHCREVLLRSEVAFSVLPTVGEGQCLRPDRTVLEDLEMSPNAPPVSCGVAAGMVRWLEQGVIPAAEEELGSSVARIEHLGAYSCRRMYGSDTGRWSEHSTGNAIDIAGFVLEDGRRINVLADWSGDGAEARFLHRARDAACDIFGTVLSPDYNEAHGDHFHLDQADRTFGSFCR